MNVASYPNSGLYLSYPLDPLAESMLLPSFSLLFCFLPWEDFSSYGLLAFSMVSTRFRGCCCRLVRIHVDPENASSYSYLLSLLNNTKEGKFNRSLIQDFLFLHHFKGRDHVIITAVKETFCFLTKKTFPFKLNLFIPTS